jgi:aspartokinase
MMVVERKCTRHHVGVHTGFIGVQHEGSSTCLVGRRSSY